MSRPSPEAAVLLAGPLRRALRPVLLDVRAVHELPARAAALWGGSLAFAALHAAVVIAVAQAVGLPLSPARVALAYLVASSAAVLLPTPGAPAARRPRRFSATGCSPSGFLCSRGW